jgi:hypothetical protein
MKMNCLHITASLGLGWLLTACNAEPQPAESPRPFVEKPADTEQTTAQKPAPKGEDGALDSKEQAEGANEAVPARAPAANDAEEDIAASVAPLEPKQATENSGSQPPPKSQVAPAAAGAKPAGAATPKKAKATAASDEKSPPKHFKGPVVANGPFSTWLEGTGPYRPGVVGTVRAVLTAQPPYKCNAEYPYKFTLDAPPSELSYPKLTVSGGNIDPKRSVLTIQVEPQASGPATVSGTLRFSVCTEDRCLVEKQRLTVQLDVE